MNSTCRFSAYVRRLVSGIPVLTMLCYGIAVCAVAPVPSRAQSVGTAALSPVTLHVDCAAVVRGDGSATHPYWRITDALENARALRRLSARRLTIHIAAGICSGNFEPQPKNPTTRPPEMLPLVLNVTNLTLHGAGVMDYSGGYPVAPHAGTATMITVDTARLGVLDNMVVYVGPTTDGGRADGTVIEGLVIDVAFNSSLGLIISRTQDLVVRGNLVQHVNGGALIGSDSSGYVVGNVVHDGVPGIAFNAGTNRNPARLYVGGNSATMNYAGVILSGAAIVTERYDMGANVLEVLPYAINPTSNEMGHHIEVDVAGNDVSNNYLGLRFQVLGVFKYPYAHTADMAIYVHDNRFIDNDGYPFSVDQGFVFRGTNNYWTNPSPDDNFFGFLATPFITHGPFDGPYSANVSAIFEHNLWKNPDVAPIAPAILTFSYIEVYDPATGAPDPSEVPVFTYMHDSRLNFVDHDRLFSQPGVIRDDLRIYDPLDGVTVLNNQTRIRH
jgi:hypothetical protein